MKKLRRKEKNKISVIIPTFNTVSTIEKCLKGLKNQTFKPVEIIIVDDESKDGLDIEVDRIKHGLKIKNLILLKQKHKGVSVARNLGAKKARGNILAFTDSDCIPSKDWLKNISAVFDDPQIGAVGGGYCCGIDNSFWQTFSCEELIFRRRKRPQFVKTLLSNNMACRRNVFWEAGGFSKKYPVCEDMLLAYKISLQNKIIWLKNSGVQHHFKTNLKDFLKHQFFFGKESTKFFLDNPDILVDNNHQGKQLHLSILAAFLTLFLFFLDIISAFFGDSYIRNILLILTIVIFGLHLLLYLDFISFLRKRNFSLINLIKAYFVSFIRDIIAGCSFFGGLALYIKR